jgi:hypothetical protein
VLLGQQPVRGRSCSPLTLHKAAAGAKALGSKAPWRKFHVKFLGANVMMSWTDGSDIMNVASPARRPRPMANLFSDDILS